MIVRSVHNMMKLAVTGFAVMGFVAVPILGKTGYEHLATLLESNSQDASAENLTQSLSDWTEQFRSDLGRDVEERQPEGDDPHRGRP